MSARTGRWNELHEQQDDGSGTASTRERGIDMSYQTELREQSGKREPRVMLAANRRMWPCRAARHDDGRAVAPNLRAGRLGIVPGLRA